MMTYHATGNIRLKDKPKQQIINAKKTCDMFKRAAETGATNMVLINK